MLPVAILAGGLASRLRPVSEKIPKSLIEVRGEPFIFHQLRLLRAGGVRRVVLCVGFLGEQVVAAVGDGANFGVNVAYSWDGLELRGTGGAIKQALPFLGPQFMVLYGDSYLPCAYELIASAFSTSGTLALMTIFKNDGKWDASNVEFQGGQILAYDKGQRTERMQYIDYGLGAFKAEAFDRVPANSVFDLAQLYGSLLKDRQVAAFEIRQRFYEVGSFNGIEELKNYLGERSRERSGGQA